MDFASLLNQIGAAWSQAEAFLVNSPELAGVGLAIIGGLIVAAVLCLVVAGLRGFSAMRRATVAASVKRMADVGARVLVVRGRPGRQRAASRFLANAMSGHLADYMFGGPYKLVDFPGAVDDEAQALKLLKRTEADLLLWPETDGGRIVARIASRTGSMTDADRPPVTLALPKERIARNEPLARCFAYAAAKQFRPALGRPQDFRAERLQPVVESLISILEQKPKADPRLLAEMVDDLSSGALQLAFSGDADWLDRAVDIARSNLAEINRTTSTDRWISAKITLGRALRLRAEKRFDPVLVQESITHLNEAMEALRSEPRFKLAESAAQAIGDAQRLLGTRRRFSISGGRI